MGYNIDIIQGLTITGFSMLVVFVGLIGISILIGGLKRIGKDKKAEVMETMEASVETVEKEDKARVSDDEGLVAVIAAAVATSMGVSLPELNIRSIKRIPQTRPAWAVASREDQIAGKL